MRTSIKLLGLAVIIALSSCNSSNMLVLKRKYNTGYYVDFNNNKTAKNINETASVKSQKNEAIVSKQKKVSDVETAAIVESNQSDVNYPVTAGNDNSIYIAPAPSHLVKTAHVKSTIAPVEEQKVEKIKNSKFSLRTLSNVKHAIKKSKSKSNNDSNFILEVILCFFPFVNLIAVYLKDGKQITVNFWLDLLLDILFFFPGIIFALLVVLDVINLA